MYNMTIGEKVRSASDIAGDIVWKEARGKGTHYVIDARNELGYQITIDVREPLLDQFAEDLDDV
jgi:hypothetical protein